MNDDSLNDRLDGYVHHQIRQSQASEDETEEVSLMVRVTGSWKSPEGFTELSRIGKIVVGRSTPGVLEALQKDPQVLSVEIPRGPGRFE